MSALIAEPNNPAFDVYHQQIDMHFSGFTKREFALLKITAAVETGMSMSTPIDTELADPEWIVKRARKIVSELFAEPNDE